MPRRKYGPYKPRHPKSQAQRNLMWGNKLRRRIMVDRPPKAIVDAITAGDLGGKLPYYFKGGKYIARDFKRLPRQKQTAKNLFKLAQGYVDTLPGKMPGTVVRAPIKAPRIKAGIRLRQPDLIAEATAAIRHNVNRSLITFIQRDLLKGVR